tara:strand:+ start:509 stop:772 length:264 start_codon:yes stop_codon:yes gene_type:complete
MTNIYIYCLFDEHDTLHGVYSSLKIVHRDAVSLINTGVSSVYMESPRGMLQPSLKTLRNTFKGVCEVVVRYRSGRRVAKILKTKIKE